MITVTTMIDMVTTLSVFTLHVFLIYPLWSKRPHAVLRHQTVFNILFQFNRGSPSKNSVYFPCKTTKYLAQ